MLSTISAVSTDLAQIAALLRGVIVTVRRTKLQGFFFASVALRGCGLL
jgi:hypothetical protein